MLNRFIDKLIYHKDKHSPDTYFKGKFFIIIQIVFFILNIVSLPYYFSSDVKLPEYIKLIFILITILFATVFFIYPRYGFRIAFVNIHSVLAGGTSFYATYYFGGGIYSPDLAFSAAITIYVYLAANRISGIIWTIIGFAQLVFYYYAETHNYYAFKSIAFDLKPDYYLFSVCFSVLFAVVIILFYEKANNGLLKLITESQKSLELKSKELEVKNEEVLASINYAKRIQYAVLPNDESILRSIPLSFIFYKPKDIVSGDFYWFHEINNNEYIIVCADCTGHGVPGALMTVIGSNLLTQIVAENKILEPSIILSELDEKITTTLKQHKAKYDFIHDGMDLSLLKVNKQKNELVYTSAKRPALLIRNNEIIELKGSKFSLGGLYVLLKKLFLKLEKVSKRMILYICLQMATLISLADPKTKNL